MARNREPVLKRCKALGISPMVMGISKETRRDPHANQRKKLSEYGLQLKEKQKLKFIYGVQEKQFYHYFELAEKQSGIVGENLVVMLESRLDNIVFRMGLATTRREARQMVCHGHFLVNGRRVDIPSYRVKEGDVIALRENSKKSEHIKQILENTQGRLVPQWLDMDAEAMSAKVIRMPLRSDLDFDLQEHLIVELYSK